LKIKLLIFVWLFYSGSSLTAFSSEGSIYTLPELTIGKDNLSPWLWGDSWEKGTGVLLNLENQKHPGSVAEELGALPSIQVPRQGLGAPPAFLMRGMDSSETRVLLEGIPFTEPVFGSQNTSVLPAVAVSAIEIHSDAVPASLLSDGLSGAINLRIFENSPKEKFLATLGNYGFIQASASAKIRGSLEADLEYSQSDENFLYLDPNGTPFNSEDDSFKRREHNGFRKASILPKGKWNLSDTAQLSAFSLNSFQDTQIPGPIQSLQNFELREFENLTSVLSQVEFNEFLRIDATGYGRFQTDKLESDDTSSNSRSVTGGARTALLWKTGAGTGKLSVGSSFSDYQLKEENNDKLFGQHWEMPVALSGNLQLHKNWEWFPSILFSRVVYQGANFSDSQFAASPRFSSQYYFSPDLRMRGTVGQFFRFPTLSEKMGNLKGIEANSGLRRETALKAEVGFDLKKTNQGFFSEQQLSYSLFGAMAENLISFSQSSLKSKRAENIGKASWIGQEVQYELKTEIGVKMSPSLQWLWTENQSDLESEKGKMLPNRFPLSAKLEALFERGKWGVGYRGNFFSHSYLDRANQRELAPYAIHDIFARFENSQIGRVQIQVQNLFNLILANSSWSGVEVKESITGISGYPDAGRRMRVTWIYDL